MVPMRYCCSVDHNHTFLGTDGQLLAQLPVPTQLCWATEARSSGSTHKLQLSRSMLYLAEQMTRTYGNADMIAKLHYRILGDVYLDKQLSYYGLDGQPESQLPPFEQFWGTYGPSGKDVRDILNDAGRSSLTLT